MNRFRLPLAMMVAAALLSTTFEAAQGQDGCNCGRKLGIGYSAGYNAPASYGGPMGYCHACRHGGWMGGGGTLGWGCCEFGANWRTHVWDDYPGEPIAQRMGGGSLHPV